VLDCRRVSTTTTIVVVVVVVVFILTVCILLFLPRIPDPAFEFVGCFAASPSRLSILSLPLLETVFNDAIANAPWHDDYHNATDDKAHYYYAEKLTRLFLETCQEGVSLILRLLGGTICLLLSVTIFGRLRV
jgi:hypothetical protein